MTPTARAQVVTRRTYNRPLDNDETEFETWEDTVERVIGHQRWLWERAKGSKLAPKESGELLDLKRLMVDRKASVSGRTLWLGGTDVSKKREASQFNCAFVRVATIHDVVDGLWLLLNGCGVGFHPVVGALNGFGKEIPKLEIIQSVREDKHGYDFNYERYDPVSGEWRISIGDSAEAWAKAMGKLLAGKHAAKKLVIDMTQIRPAGGRLEGYGWICSGDGALADAYEAIFELMNKQAGKLLSKIDILDLLNWLGTILSSRRSAEIALVDYGTPEWQEFANAKHEYWLKNPQRAQSNNSLVFHSKPSHGELADLFQNMIDAGGSEPGFINGEAALKRAPWFKGVNPCAEILLGDKSFCNLVEIDLGKFNDDWDGLKKAVRLMARANYRQTCVDLDDGMLQRTWHEGNEFLRLCGVGVTGVVRWDMADDVSAWQDLRQLARTAVDKMADSLGTPRAKAVTTVKPSGTLSKIMDTTEGVHKPLGKYVFNNINFSKYDKIVDKLRDAGYNVFDNPMDKGNVLVTFPVSYEDVEFETVDGVEVNLESAIAQLERYKLLMQNYVDHNCSITVSYDPDEVEEIIDWIMDNWDIYVGVSWLFRNDPTKTAADLGYLYLPQEVVTRQKFEAYVATLAEVDLSNQAAGDLDASDCATGACPIR